MMYIDHTSYEIFEEKTDATDITNKKYHSNLIQSFIGQPHTYTWQSFLAVQIKP